MERAGEELALDAKIQKRGKGSFNLKFIVITLLLTALGFTVYKMMEFEDSVRESRIIKVGNITEKKLLPEISGEELKNLAVNSEFHFKTEGDYFSVEETRIKEGVAENYWRRRFLRGVNMGVALPGHYPSEFSASYDTYYNWFRQIAAMNANNIRIYTILPPEFYEAFAQYNVDNFNRPLYLMQGVWADDCDSGDYFEKSYTENFKHEIKDVIDVIHGNAIIKERTGHASGTYARDVSRYVVGILLGREWEPATVKSTNKKNEAVRSFAGDFISMPNGNPMEAWLAQMMDFAVRAETQLYKVQRPVSFVNWLPLDPMFHNSEFIESNKVREYDNDIASLDYRRFFTTPIFRPGLYAAYHAYPYYPDYIYLDDKYRNGTNHLGEPDNYYAYLSDLKNHCPGMPLIIAEYGLPSSRGNSHATLLGLDQGGHSEKDQAELNKQLTEDIFHSGCGGAIYFEWIDEWFKFNWLVIDFEVPAERRKLWHNMENPEQNFGVIAVEQRTKVIDGLSSDWNKRESAGSQGNKASVSLSSDAEYFYILIESKQLDLNTEDLRIAIDTYDKRKGSHKLPGISSLTERGYEFLLNIRHKDSAEILVDEPYSVYSDIYAGFVPVYSSRENNEGKFVRQILLSNRERETLTGEKFPRRIYDRSSLLTGNSSDPQNSNSNMFIDTVSGTIEIRLPWHLLNVSDPSSSNVLDDIEGTPEIESSETEGFNLLVYFVSKDGAGTVMNNNEEEINFRLKKWDVAEYKLREKETYRTFAGLFPTLKVTGVNFPEDVETKFELAEWYGNKDGAITVSFDDGTITQYSYGLPVLDKYKIKGTFALISDWTKEHPAFSAEKGGLSVEKMGWQIAKQLIRNGHEIASHGVQHVRMDTMSNELLKEVAINSKLYLESKLDTTVNTFVFPYSATRDEMFRIVSNSGYLFARTGEESINEKESLDLHRLTAIAIYNQNTPSMYELYSKFMAGTGKWLILNYHNIFPEDSKEMNIFRTHDIYSTYSVTPDMFDNQIRLVRNTGRWNAPLQTVGKFILQYKNAKLATSMHENKYLVTINCEVENIDQFVPMTIVMTTSWKYVNVRGTLHDGIYNPVSGKIIINAMPNREFVVEKMEPGK